MRKIPRRPIGPRQGLSKNPRLKLQVAKVLDAISRHLEDLPQAAALEPLSINDRAVLERIKDNLSGAMTLSRLTPADLANARRIAKKLGIRKL